MKPNHASENDEPLHELLAQWKVAESLPPRFQEQVWKRIEQAETHKPQSSLAALVRWIEAAFRRPALASAYVAVLLFVGLGAGYWRAQDTMTQSQSELRARYVQSVDPYQAPRN
jgi:deferrochelatase/peroxidase EfeB